MNKTSFVKGIIHLTVIVMLAGMLCSCADMVSGRRYTMAKVSRDDTLIEARNQIKPPTEEEKKNGCIVKDMDLDSEITQGNVIGINLNGGYIRYLQEFARPEIAIFARTRVHDRSNPESDFVYERVLMATEKKGADIMLNKDSTLPQMDLAILPPIEYSGEDLTVELRVIELNKQDNERTKQLIGAAASTAAVLKPEAAGAISVFQTVLTFLTSNRSDTIEFMTDFNITSGANTVTNTKGTKNDLVLKPRIGKYAIIKTEHPERIIYPKSYFNYLPDAIRFTIAQVLRIASANSWGKYPFNSGVWKYGNGEYNDPYLLLLGSPFSVKNRAANEPTFKKGAGVKDEDILYTDDYFERQFRVVNGELYFVEADNGKPIDDGKQYPFRDQSYLLYSIISPKVGTPMKYLRDKAQSQKEIESLGINTAQISAKELETQLTTITDSVKGWAAEKFLKDKYDAMLAKAKTPEEIDRILSEKKRVISQTLSNYLTPETKFDLEQDMQKRADEQQKVLLNAEFKLRPSTIYSGATLNMMLIKPAGVTYSVRYGQEGNFNSITIVADPLFTDRLLLQNVSVNKAGSFSLYVSSNDKTTPLPYHVAVKPACIIAAAAATIANNAEQPAASLDLETAKLYVESIKVVYTVNGTEEVRQFVPEVKDEILTFKNITDTEDDVKKDKVRIKLLYKQGNVVIKNNDATNPITVSKLSIKMEEGLEDVEAFAPPVPAPPVVAPPVVPAPVPPPPAPAPTSAPTPK